MDEVYSGVDVTWSSIESYISYNKVTWYKDKDGIPRYNFFDEYGNKIR